MRHNFDRYCKNIENIENYEKAKADNFKGWHCHHRREANFSRKELITLGMYYNVSSEELIFLTIAEHNKLHKKGNTYMLGKHLSEETKKKLSDAKKGKYTGESNPMYGKHFSEESKKKISKAKKGKYTGESNPMYGKRHSLLSIQKMSEAKKGKHASKETKKKMSLQRTGRHWYNDGKVNKFCYECPDGFIPGQLR